MRKEKGSTKTSQRTILGLALRNETLLSSNSIGTVDNVVSEYKVYLNAANVSYAKRQHRSTRQWYVKEE